MEPKANQFTRKTTYLMSRQVFIENYLDPINPIVLVHIKRIIVPNVLINLGSIFNVMIRQTMEQLCMPNLCPTHTIIEFVYQSNIKLKVVFDDIIVILDS